MTTSTITARRKGYPQHYVEGNKKVARTRSNSLLGKQAIYDIGARFGEKGACCMNLASAVRAEPFRHIFDQLRCLVCGVLTLLPSSVLHEDKSWSTNAWSDGQAKRSSDDTNLWSDAQAKRSRDDSTWARKENVAS